MSEFPGFPVIDYHIHIQPWWQLKPDVQQTMSSGRANYAELLEVMKNPEKCLALMDDAGIERAGLINYVAPDLMGFDDSCCEYVIEYAAADPFRLLPYGSVNPRLRTDCGARIRQLIDLGMKAVKVHPPHQLLEVNDYLDLYPHQAEIYEECQKSHIPVMVHTGTSIFPGARNKHARCMPVDDVALDFPDLTIVMAHGGRPLYMDEAFFLVRRHKNVHMDISGIPPSRLLTYFPRLANIADKVLWGTDWPGPGVPDMKSNIAQFWSLDLDEGVKKSILYDNAAKILNP